MRTTQTTTQAGNGQPVSQACAAAGCIITEEHGEPARCPCCATYPKAHNNRPCTVCGHWTDLDTGKPAGTPEAS